MKNERRNGYGYITLIGVINHKHTGTQLTIFNTYEEAMFEGKLEGSPIPIKYKTNAGGMVKLDILSSEEKRQLIVNGILSPKTARDFNL